MCATLRTPTAVGSAAGASTTSTALGSRWWGWWAVGVPADDPAIVAGANWLLTHQQACGGWANRPTAYEFPHLRGQGTPTASQTAWALMGLVAAGLPDHPAVTRGIRYLVRMQNDDGTWDEPEFTGTGFPRVFTCDITTTRSTSRFWRCRSGPWQ